MSKRCSIEQYGTALAQHFVHTYPRVSCCCCRCCQVSKAKVWVEQAPWKRVEVGGIPHDHGEAGWGCRPAWRNVEHQQQLDAARAAKHARHAAGSTALPGCF